MRAGKDIRASESVTEGHPDKVMDIIADSILDNTMREVGNTFGPEARELVRFAMDGVVKGDDDGGQLSLVGEVTMPEGLGLDYSQIARDTIREIGYTNPEEGFWYGLGNLSVNLTTQSPDIGVGVNGQDGAVKGAGDQGIVFGYATGEHESLMPVPIQVAHAMTARLTDLRKSGYFEWLKPDGKSQVGINYQNGKPVSVEHVTLAASHDPNHTLRDVRHDLYREVIVPVLDGFNFGLDISEEELFRGDGRVIINGTGKWDSKWGPYADSGEVGRKLDVDTYGGAAQHGGGALSGKDPSKVDRSGKYVARYVARELVQRGIVDRVLFGLTYTIGSPEPDSIMLDTFGTSRLSQAQIAEIIHNEIIDLRVAQSIQSLGLFQFDNYAQTARNGHFGHAEFPWEQSK